MASDGPRGVEFLASLSPRRWPVRWQLAAVSASLTLFILIVFAFVVGRLATDRLKSDFEKEVVGTATQIAAQAHVEQNPLTGGRSIRTRAMPPSSDDAVSVVYSNGQPVPNELQQPVPNDAARSPSFGAPEPGEVSSVDDYFVSSSVVPATANSFRPVFVQYARDKSSLDATLDRLWLFLGGGVVGGTMLAALAGLAVAGRAMRPIAALTAAAKDIAATRDPSRRIPRPPSDDEVAELASTLDEMLRQLDAARGETEQMVQAQREFVADASHELRTPLTSILANLELLQTRVAGQDASGEEAEMVEGALRSSKRMRRLVSDLLLLARADAGRLGVRRRCDLEEILDTALAEVRPFATDHRLALEAPEPVAVEGNPDELHRLAVNLLENAVRHTPPGSEVLASVRRNGSDAVLEVADDGPGIPEGFERQMFSRFVRGGGPADVASDPGTGLGLAIVKAVAESHGGTVNADNLPRGGARFSVRLPLGEGVAAPPDRAPAEV